ncbi:hypothetical protein RBU49_10825 [Clostridium sp. MB40-C1]|uniref:hypothetical protein n=1 Tax=Clostridium sp. MB40-C1 TaxID=3070996 RepID=UPI0027DF97FA|nr:hypothetical protein [Clostridium sp. MB40-C1]WMJ79383.1 hypothetical protein RBU49_10825 [Clostridium sp. MB40-C1]
MRKMDEMELYISLKAIKYAWFYTVLFLFIWIVYDYLNQGVLNLPALFLLNTQNIIYLGINQFFKWKLSKDEK